MQDPTLENPEPVNRKAELKQRPLSLFVAVQIANQAGWDRALRIVVGLGMIYIGWLGSPLGLVGAALRVFGPVPLLTGVLGWDPLYALLGIGTKKKQ